MASPLYIPPSAELTTVQMVGPTGTKVVVNLHEIDDFRRQGYKPIGGGEKIVVKDTGTPETGDKKEVGLNGDQRAIKDDANQPPVGRAANNETGKGSDQKAEQPVGWLKGDDAKLAKMGKDREAWQIDGDDAFKTALDGGKSIQQATSAAYKAARAVEGSPLK